MLASSHRTREKVLDFLVSMNEQWNAYMLQVLDIDLDKNMYLSQPEEVHIQAIKAKFVVARDNIELVGAHVCIHSCKQKRHLVDIHGLMVGETKNTWAVAILSRSGRKKRRRKASEHEEKGDHVETSYVGNLNPTEIVIVPKDGSSLDLIIPLSGTSTKAGAPPSTDNSQDTSLQMFPIVHRSIYVRLSS
jgi:RNase P/RNase MRP subunit p29